MIQFEINLPKDMLEARIFRDQIYCKSPPMFGLFKYNRNQLLGGKMSRKYWMANRETAFFYKYESYFLYELIPQGNTTIVKGKFVYSFYERWGPFLFFELFSAYMLIFVAPIKSFWRLLKGLLIVFIFPFGLNSIFNYMCDHSKSYKYQKKVIIDYFSKIKEDYDSSE